MNPRNLSVSDLVIWGIVLHLVADWPLQSDWMAKNKTSLGHVASYVHGFIHGVLLSLVFGLAAVPLAILHMLIDTRKPVIWWSKLWRQTPPGENGIRVPGKDEYVMLYDMGTEVRIWVDQVFHIICIAVAALLIA